MSYSLCRIVVLSLAIHFISLRHLSHICSVEISTAKWVCDIMTQYIFSLCKKTLLFSALSIKTDCCCLFCACWSEYDLLQKSCWTHDLLTSAFIKKYRQHKVFDTLKTQSFVLWGSRTFFVYNLPWQRTVFVSEVCFPHPLVKWNYAIKLSFLCGIIYGLATQNAIVRSAPVCRVLRMLNFIAIREQQG